jgi:hypothetical protein
MHRTQATHPLASPLLLLLLLLLLPGLEVSITGGGGFKPAVVPGSTEQNVEGKLGNGAARAILADGAHISAAGRTRWIMNCYLYTGNAARLKSDDASGLDRLDPGAAAAAPVAKSVGWFVGGIHDLNGHGASEFLSTSNLTDRLLPCCNSLSILPNGSLGPSHYGNMSHALYGGATEILVDLGGTAAVVPKIAARKEAFAQEVLQMANTLDVNGFTMDWEFGAVMNWSSWNETMSFVADVLHKNGKKLGVCIETGCGDNLPSWRGGTNPPCATLFRNMPWADKLTDMGTYTLGGNTTASRHHALAARECPSPVNKITQWCGLEGEVLNHLRPLQGTNPPEFRMRAADGQYSAGLSPNSCTENGTVAGGWTDETLHAFLLWLDSVGVRSIDIWCGGGVVGGNGGCNTLSSGVHGVAQPCTWFLRRITQWRFNELEELAAINHVPLKTEDSEGHRSPPGAQQLLSTPVVNLVKNPSFEQTDGAGSPASWSISTDVYARATVGCHAGSSACLQWKGTDPKVYRFATQNIKAVLPGALYTMSASIKTLNLTSPKGGYASITGSWLHENGKYYDGTWPMGLHGTTDWQTVSGTFRLPSDAKSGSFVLALYVRATKPSDPVPTGEAWWDNVTLSLAPKPPKPCPIIPPPPLSGNLVRNPNFGVVGGANAGPCEWSALAGPEWRRSTAANTTLPGVPASLRFNGTDPTVYKMVQQHIPEVLPGVSYDMSASVKTVNLTSLRGGYASITATWTDVDPVTGKTHYGGSWPSGPAGTTDGWVNVTGMVSIPATARPGSFTLLVYVRPFLQGDPTPTGVAFFDNVSVVHAPPVPLRTTLISPVYRGQLHSSGDSDSAAVIVRAHFIFDTATVIPEVAIQLELRARPADGKILWRHSLLEVNNTSLAHDYNVSQMMADAKQVLSPGYYSLSVACLNTTGTPAVMAVDLHNLTVLPLSASPLVSIDQHSRVVINGTTPFFPMGFIGYCTTLRNESLMRALSPAGFNIVMPYGECTTHDLDLAQQSGIKIAFSLKDIYQGLTLHYTNETLANGAEEEAYFRKRVNKFRHHPAVLAWYIKDDGIKPTDPRVLTHHQWAIEEDADHPTWQIQPGSVSTSDVFGADDYPIGYIGENASNMRDSANELNTLTDSARPWWQIIQSMNWAMYNRPECKRKNNDCHTPTLAEVRSMTWISIAAGSNGIFFYAAYTLGSNSDVGFTAEWDVLSTVATEVQQFAPMLMAQPLSATPTGAMPSWLMLRAHLVNATSCYVFAVSDGRGGGSVELKPSGLPPSTSISSVTVANTSPPRHVVVGTGGLSFTAQVESMAVVVYHVQLQNAQSSSTRLKSDDTRHDSINQHESFVAYDDRVKTAGGVCRDTAVLVASNVTVNEVAPDWHGGGCALKTTGDDTTQGPWV